jgi:hypothetical protein
LHHEGEFLVFNGKCYVYSAKEMGYSYRNTTDFIYSGFISTNTPWQELKIPDTVHNMQGFEQFLCMQLPKTATNSTKPIIFLIKGKPKNIQIALPIRYDDHKNHLPADYQKDKQVSKLIGQDVQAVGLLFKDASGNWHTEIRMRLHHGKLAGSLLDFRAGKHMKLYIPTVITY